MLVLIWLIKLVISETGPWSLLGFQGYSGQVQITEDGSSLFYNLNYKKNSKIEQDRASLVLWFNGGPGCSVQADIIGRGVGPFKINQNLEPYQSPFSWTEDFHILSVDFPFDAGYSFALNQTDYKNTTRQAVEYLYTFLISLKNDHPAWFSHREIYVYGHSYAGHWVSALSYKILTEGQLKINGVVLGSPLFNGLMQNRNYSDVAFAVGLIDEVQKEKMKVMQDGIYQDVLKGDMESALAASAQLLGKYYVEYTAASYYDMRTYVDDFPLFYIDWLNLNSTKNLFHVPLERDYVDCSSIVFNAFAPDYFTDFSQEIAYVLEKVKFLVYSNQDDLIVNSVGVKSSLELLEWSGIEQLFASRRSEYRVNGKIVGYSQFYGNFRFVQMIDSGHTLTQHQPEAARDLFLRFVYDFPFNQIMMRSYRLFIIWDLY